MLYSFIILYSPIIGKPWRERVSTLGKQGVKDEGLHSIQEFWGEELPKYPKLKSKTL
jgi:hypothetical protein